MSLSLVLYALIGILGVVGTVTLRYLFELVDEIRTVDAEIEDDVA